MAKALQNGTVDAMVTSSLYRTNNERILEKFGSSDFYVIVKKGNTELLDQVNYAIDQMNAAEGNWKTTLYSKITKALMPKIWSIRKKKSASSPNIPRTILFTSCATPPGIPILIQKMAR